MGTLGTRRARSRGLLAGALYGALCGVLTACGPRDDPVRLCAEGKRHMDEKRYAAAIEPLQRAFAADPRATACGVALVEVLVQEERPAEALEVCRRLDAEFARQGSPRDPEGVKARAKTAFLAARSLRELGRPADAEREVMRSLQLLPRNGAARALLGGILLQLDRPAEALPHLEEALAATQVAGSPQGMEQMHYQLGRCLAALGRKDEAARQLARHQELKAQSDLAASQEREVEYGKLEAEAARRDAAAGAAAGSAGGSRGAMEGATAVSPTGVARTDGAFADRARECGIDFRHDSGARGALHPYETIGGGAAWLDFDVDGDPDLYLVSGQSPKEDGSFPVDGKNRLYRNDGSRFSDVTASAGVAGHGFGLGAIAGDVDNDGAPDLYVLCFGPNIVYRNRGDGTFAEVKSSGAEGTEPFTAGAAFCDLDGDGLLDLFVSTYFRYDTKKAPRCFDRSLRTGQPLPVYCGPVSYEGGVCAVYRGLGDGRFRDVTRESGVGGGADARAKGLGVLAADFDDDGDVDVFVACDTTANLFYRNRGDGRLEEVGLEVGVAVSDAGVYEGSMGTAIGDLNGDGRADLFVTNFAEESNRAYLGAEGGAFLDGTTRTGLGAGSRPLVGWGTGCFDLRCDGKLEVFVVNGHIYPNAEEWIPGRTYRQRSLLYSPREQRYEEIGLATSAAFAQAGACRGAAMADYDGDGDVDILVVEIDGPPRLLRAEGPHGHWLEVDLAGSGAGGRDAIGAKVEVATRSGRQTRWRYGGGSYLSSDEPRLHFGLGDDDRAETITVTWPGGRKSVARGVSCDRRWAARP